MVVELYSKRRCPLCEEAQQVVAQVTSSLGVRFELRYVEDSPDLYSRFRYEVPVVAVDGEVAFLHRVDPEALRRRLVEDGMGVAATPPEDA